MATRFALALPLVFAVLGCGAAPPPAAAPPVEPAGAAAAPRPADAPAEAKEKDKGDKPPAEGADPSGGLAAPKRAVVDAPLSGALGQAEIARILEKQGKLFDECYSLGAGKSKDFRAVVTVKATVGPTGSVNDAEVLKSTAKSSKVDTCVREAFKKVKFPPPKNGGTTVITFPINFAGVEQVQ